MPAAGGLASVDRVHLPRRGVVDDEEAPTSDAGRVGLGDAQGSGRRDRRVDGVAALGEDLESGGGRIGIDRAAQQGQTEKS